MGLQPGQWRLSPIMPKVPVLGSGKLDFAAVTKMVRDEEALKTKAA